MQSSWHLAVLAIIMYNYHVFIINTIALAIFSFTININKYRIVEPQNIDIFGAIVFGVGV